MFRILIVILQTNITTAVKSILVLLLPVCRRIQGTRVPAAIHCLKNETTWNPNPFKSRMVSYGMLRRVALVRTDVSEEPSASFIRVTRICELGTTQAATSNRRTLRRNTKWERKLKWNSELWIPLGNIPENTILHSHRRKNLKSSILNQSTFFITLGDSD
jgi:hypothetical protein